MLYVLIDINIAKNTIENTIMECISQFECVKRNIVPERTRMGTLPTLIRQRDMRYFVDE